MAKIYFEKASKHEFKKNIYDFLYSKHDSKERQIILVKKYPKIIELLQSTCLIKDVNNIIGEYINDVLTLEYDTEFRSYAANNLQNYIIHIRSHDVVINNIKYTFEYAFHVDYINGDCIQNSTDKIVMLYVLCHTNNDNYHIITDFQSNDIIAFFNTYIEKYYGYSQYIPCQYQYPYQYDCKYNDNKFTIMHPAYNEYYAIISNINHKKMKNIIVMFKVIIYAIRKILLEHADVVKII